MDSTYRSPQASSRSVSAPSSLTARWRPTFSMKLDSSWARAAIASPAHLAPPQRALSHGGIHDTHACPAHRAQHDEVVEVPVQNGRSAELRELLEFHADRPAPQACLFGVAPQISEGGAPLRDPEARAIPTHGVAVTVERGDHRQTRKAALGAVGRQDDGDAQRMRSSAQRRRAAPWRGSISQSIRVAWSRTISAETVIPGRSDRRCGSDRAKPSGNSTSMRNTGPPSANSSSGPTVVSDTASTRPSWAPYDGDGRQEDERGEQQPRKRPRQERGVPKPPCQTRQHFLAEKSESGRRGSLPAGTGRYRAVQRSALGTKYIVNGCRRQPKASNLDNVSMPVSASYHGRP